MKKLVLILSIILIATAVLGSCANVVPIDENSTVSTASVDTESEESEVSLPDYHGFTDHIVIATTDTDPFVQYEDTFGTLGTTIVDRTLLLAEKYNVDIQTHYFTEAEIENDAASSSLSGLGFADLYCFPAELTARLALQGRLGNMVELPNFDNIKELVGDDGLITDGSGVYAVVHSSTLYQEATYCVFYNKSLVGKVTLQDPAVLYEHGLWTYDVYNELSRSIAADTMSKGSIDYANDIFGYASADDADGMICALWSSLGKEVQTFGENGVSISNDVVGIDDDLAVLYDTYNGKAKLGYDKAEAAEVFEDGRCGFFIYRFDYCKRVGTLGLDYGVVPMPSLSGEGTGYVDKDALVFSIGTTKDKEYVSAALTAIIAASGDSFEKCLRDTYTLLYSDCNNMTVMISRILSSAKLNKELLWSLVDEKVDSISRANIFDAIKNGTKIEPKIDLPEPENSEDGTEAEQSDDISA